MAKITAIKFNNDTQKLELSIDGKSTKIQCIKANEFSIYIKGLRKIGMRDKLFENNSNGALNVYKYTMLPIMFNDKDGYDNYKLIIDYLISIGKILAGHDFYSTELPSHINEAEIVNNNLLNLDVGGYRIYADFSYSGREFFIDNSFIRTFFDYKSQETTMTPIGFVKDVEVDSNQQYIAKYLDRINDILQGHFVSETLAGLSMEPVVTDETIEFDYTCEDFDITKSTLRYVVTKDGYVLYHKVDLSKALVIPNNDTKLIFNSLNTLIGDYIDPLKFTFRSAFPDYANTLTFLFSFTLAKEIKRYLSNKKAKEEISKINKPDTTPSIEIVRIQNTTSKHHFVLHYKTKVTGDYINKSVIFRTVTRLTINPEVIRLALGIIDECPDASLFGLMDSVRIINHKMFADNKEKVTEIINYISERVVVPVFDVNDKPEVHSVNTELFIGMVSIRIEYSFTTKKTQISLNNPEISFDINDIESVKILTPSDRKLIKDIVKTISIYED